MLHSVAGGTGSGLGSSILEDLSDRYARKVVQTYSTFPVQDAETSEVVVQPYNAVLTLQRLALHSDLVTVLDNTSLEGVLSARSDSTFSLEMSNGLLAKIIASSSQAQRFPSYLNSDLLSPLATLAPIPRCHFLVPAYAPVRTSDGYEATVTDVLRKLMQKKNWLLTNNASEGLLVSAMITLQGALRPEDVNRGLKRIEERKLAEFVPWVPNSLHITPVPKSPFCQSESRYTGMLSANFTGIRHLFQSILKQYNKLRSRSAFLENYRQEPIFEDSLDEFDNCRYSVEELIAEYQAAEGENYIDWAS